MLYTAAVTTKAAAGAVDAAGDKPAWLVRLLYDGDCPLCLREVNFLKGRDEKVRGDHALGSVLKLPGVNDCWWPSGLQSGKLRHLLASMSRSRMFLVSYQW